jgi:hypothetical protein
VTHAGLATLHRVQLWASRKKEVLQLVAWVLLTQVTHPGATRSQAEHSAFKR